MEEEDKRIMDSIMTTETESCSTSSSPYDLDFIPFKTSKQIMDSDIPPREFLLYPLIPKNTTIVCVGETGVGKSVFLHSIVSTLSQGEHGFLYWLNTSGVPHLGNGNFTDFSSRRKVKCLYIDGEMTETDWKERIPSFGNKDDDLMFHCRSEYKTEKRIPQGFFEDKEVQDYWIEIIKKHDFELIVFDNLTSLSSVDENSKKEFDVLNQFFISLRSMGKTIIVVHHMNKQKTQRGTTSHIDNVDGCWNLHFPKNHNVSDGISIKLSFSKFRQHLPNPDLMKKRNLKYDKDKNEWMSDVYNDEIEKENFMKSRILDYLTQKTENEKNLNTQRQIVNLMKNRHEIDTNQSTISRLSSEFIKRGLMTKNRYKTEDGLKFIEEHS